MYFSIPDTTEISPKRSADQHAYTLFNIHIDGLHHCSLRYSQLRAFHDELQRLLPNAMINTQPFPPRKLFSLSSLETKERRLLLERYLQSIAQKRPVISSSYYTGFFFNAQRETFLNASTDRTLPERIDFTIHLLNKHPTLVENLSPNDTLAKLLAAFAKQIQLENEYLPYFSLFLYELHDHRLNLIRPLFSLESPYISLQQAARISEHCCLVFKKSYWDPTYDLQLLENRCTQNLLFLQCQYDIQQSYEFDSSDMHKQLEVFQDSNQLKEYILVARTSKFSGCVILRPCSVTDVVTLNSCPCVLAIGNNELVCHYIDGEKNMLVKNVSFKVIRIRCWKVNWTQADLNITFEYLVRKNTLQWITIHTDQAALVSTCLQSMVDEILAKKTEPPSSSTHEETKTSTNRASTKGGLATRTKSDLDRLNNNELFEKGDGDDDL